MNQKEKIMSLIEEAGEIVHSNIRSFLKEHGRYNSKKDGRPVNEVIADHMLANGVIVLPCKVGDSVYTNVSMQGWYMRMKDRPYKAKIAFIGINGTDNFINVTFENGNMLQFKFSDFGKTVFLTREEAEKALAERGKQYG